MTTLQIEAEVSALLRENKAQAAKIVRRQAEVSALKARCAELTEAKAESDNLAGQLWQKLNVAEKALSDACPLLFHTANEQRRTSVDVEQAKAAFTQARAALAGKGEA
jgi:hypothetical protein